MVRNLHVSQPFSLQYQTRLALIQAYGKWVQQYLDNAWDGYFFSFMFRQLPGSSDAIMEQMQREVSIWYGRLLTRVATRNLKSAKWAPWLPKGIFVPDLPVYKKSKQSIRDVAINDGLHMHGIVVANRLVSRVHGTLDIHVAEKLHQYLIPKLRHIDVEPITHETLKVTGYGMKGLKRPIFSPDHVLILPRSLSELPDRKRLPSPRDPIKDIQAAFNVSDELAREIANSSPPTRSERALDRQARKTKWVHAKQKRRDRSA